MSIDDQSIENWQDFQNLDPDAFDDYSDEWLLDMATNLVDVDLSAEDLAKYMPQYDKRGEDNIRKELKYGGLQTAQEIGDFGQSKQGDLLDQAIARQNQMGKGGFAATGNPILDRQRRNVFQDISQQGDRVYQDHEMEQWKAGEDIYRLKEDYQEDWAERLISYEDKIETDEAIEAAEFDEYQWYNPGDWFGAHDEPSEWNDGIDQFQWYNPADWFGAHDEEKTCVLSTAAYAQGLITDDELMSFVKWRIKTQKNEFLAEQKWLGYQIVWKPISKLMLKSKTFAKLINNTLLKGWKGRIAGKKAYLTRLIIEGLSLIGYILRPKKAKELKKRLKKIGLKGMLQSYKKLIMTKKALDKKYKDGNHVNL